MKVLSFNVGDKELFNQACEIRKIVFIKEMNISPEDEFEFDDEATHYLLYDDNKAVACARWRETKEGVKLERFAVLKSHRGKGLGQLILKRLLEDCVGLNKYIYLYAQFEAVDFYLKNGFTAKGDQFLDAGIKHLLMEYNY